MPIRAALLLSVGLAASLPALADDGWTGEGSFSAGYTTGNTETTDVGLGLDLTREDGPWTVMTEAAVDYGETDSVETKNRFFVAGEVDRLVGEKLFGFVRSSYEQDQFSGFDSRLFVGGGLGYPIFDEEPVFWSVKAGPGLKVDEVKRTTVIVDGTPVVRPATTEESLSFIGNSAFTYEFNDAVKLTNDTNVIYAQESTQIGNVIALTAALTDTLSARFSVDVRHDTNPPAGFEATDTATKASVVYSFGG
ncbi:DUF481 domain-containing protein [Henriciella aquimarina]|uniref:DUF481 domain-containing protein n=1 Tax=Henriciella aquimarina TaxID=545261 RepID=UPI000A032420|nr:DUF481 domain-containing protein [Henriciella aquimarina]